MAKLIKGWEDLVGLENDKFKLDIELKNGCGWIRPKEETLETEDHWFNNHAYLSTHTFYGKHYKYSTELLQRFGFDVEIDNWDKEESDND